MDAFAEFLKQYPLVTYKKGEVIISQGEIPTRALVIKTGLIKKYDLGRDGSERLIDISVSLDIVPDSWVFGKSQSALYFYEALSECQVHWVPRADLVQFVGDTPAFERELLDRYLSVYVAQTLRISALTYSIATEKLLHTLRYLCIRFGKPEHEDHIELTIYLTHQQLAELLGLSRETTTNELIKLKKKDVIDYDRKKITVRASKLSEAIGSLEYDDLTLLG